MATEIIGADEVDGIISGAFEIVGADNYIVAGMDEGVDVYAGADADAVDRILAAASSGDTLAIGRELARNRMQPPPRQTPPRQAPPRPQMRYIPPNARVVQVKQEKPTHQRKFPLGFNSGAAVGAGSVVTITQRPQVIFRGERIVIAASIAGSFDILDVKVGKNSQFAASGAIPADTFGPDATDTELHMDTASPGQDIFLSIQNISGAPLVFRGSIIGVAVE